MRRTLLSILIGLCLTWPCAAQDPNPQSSFATTLLRANPSLYLNFNDPTASFKDQISGVSFTSAPTYTGTAGQIITPTNDNSSQYVCFNAYPLVPGSLSSVSVQYKTAPTSGQSLTFVVGSVPSGNSITIVASFTVTLAATSAIQTFTAPANFTAVTVTQGEVLGTWSGSPGNEPGYVTTGGAGIYYYPSSSLPSGARTYFPASSYNYASDGFVTTGTVIPVTPLQPGFDSTLINNTSAEFPWYGWNAAPNDTLGAIEWNTPWSMMVQIDRLNWSRTGTLVLASKGDLASGNSWQLYLQMTANTWGDAHGQVSQLCFSRISRTSAPNTGFGVSNGICTSSSNEAMPNGFNYNIIVTDSGTGGSGFYGSTSDLDIYINGLDNASGLQDAPFDNSYQISFGDVGIAYIGGTGYANSTAFTSSGGGANCLVSGSLLASGGVPNGISWNYDGGCTSLPTITLTSPTGTGVTLTSSLAGTSMNSASSPLMVPGYVSGGTFYGVAGTNSAETPTYIDEFAIFPGNLSQTSIQSLFYWTKFYQTVSNIVPSTRIAVLLALDGCGDMANPMGVGAMIFAHKKQLLDIQGVIATGEGGINTFDESVPIFRQMFDQAGLANIPLGYYYGGSYPDLAWCAAANITTFNASTPTTEAGFPYGINVARQVFANNPATPVMINQWAFGWNWVYDFLQSPADSISSLTGKQLWDRNISNGGYMWSEAAPFCAPSSPPATTPCTGSLGFDSPDVTDAQYVLTHLDGLPLYFGVGTPQQQGPGILFTRTPRDPIRLAAVTIGTDVRVAFGQYTLLSMFSSYFTGGVTVGYSGGTGYANLTPFTSTGGGANCSVNGYMTASGGVPNGITTSWGSHVPVDATGGPIGLGSGCTSAPTIVLTAPTGTGVTLTAYPTIVCTTPTVVSNYVSFSSSTCSNIYQVPFTQWATRDEGAPFIYTWTLNSLGDPPLNGRPLGVQ